MTDYSTISIDKTTKNRASKRAKKDRMTVSVITRILLNDYADGKISIGSQMAITQNGFTPEFEDMVLKAEKEALSGVNLSGPFEGKEAIEHLKKLADEN